MPARLSRQKNAATWAAYRPYLCYALVMLLLCGVLIFAARNSATFSEWYATTVYSFFSQLLARMTDILPCSLFELLLILLAAGIVALLGYLIYALLKRRPLHWLAKLLLCLVPTLLFMFVLGSGINYTRTTFAQTYALEIHYATPAKLEQLCLLLIEDAAAALNDLPASDGGPTEQPRDMITQCRDAMGKLGEQYPTLARYYGRPKAAWLSPLLSRFNTTGIFSPFTIEAHYNNRILPYARPYTICHELAHMAGYAREDEAGFIGYLACANSADAFLRYSGALLGLTYTLNAYYQTSGSEQYAQILKQLPEQVQIDYAANRRYWAQYKDQPAATLAERSNDLYLRINQQPDGTRSYSRIVDLLLAYHNDHILLRLEAAGKQ